MSLPRELLDDLLSRHLDGRLSNDERHRVEQLLAEDESARRSYEQLQKQSDLIRRLLTSSPKLGEGFAGRVVQAAINEAASESLPLEHPLRLAGRGEKAAVGTNRRRVAAVLALAVTIVFALFALRGWEDSDVVQPNGVQVADNSESPTGENLAQADSTNTGEVEPTLPGDSPSTTELAQDGTPENSAATELKSQDPPELLANNDSPTDRVDSNQSVPMETLEGDSNLPLDPSKFAMQNLRAVLVYEIEVNELGRRNNVVGRLFRNAGIVEAERREVDEALASYLEAGNLVADETTDRTAENVSVVFLEGSGLKLERLMFDFVEAEQEVPRVGFNIAFDAPVASAVSNLSNEMDVTKIRQPEENEENAVVAQRLVRGELGGLNSDAFVSGSLQFQPLQRDSADDLRQLQPTSGDSPDITSQVLLLIRQVP